MLDDARLRHIADRLVAVPGVVGVVLGGSRARGDHLPESDVDLGLYYRPALDTGALRSLARELTGSEVPVTEPGAWGPWVDGGAWLTVDGHSVDWIYRHVDRVRHSWDQAQSGHLDFHPQPGHPLGVASVAYAGEIALARVLADPSGELTALQRTTAHYPAALRAAGVDRLWEADLSVDIARKGAARGDATYVAGCLFRTLELCAQALHAHSGSWLINEKGAITAAGRLAAAPDDFAARAHGLMAALGGDAVTLEAAATGARQLLDQVREACRG